MLARIDPWATHSSDIDEASCHSLTLHAPEASKHARICDSSILEVKLFSNIRTQTDLGAIGFS